MTPDIDALTPPCCRLSSLAEPLLGHQLWRGIDGSRARVHSIKSKVAAKVHKLKEFPVLCWPRILVSPPMGLELEAQLGLLLFPTCAGISLGRCCLHILNPTRYWVPLPPLLLLGKVWPICIALMQPLECLLPAENGQIYATSVIIGYPTGTIRVNLCMKIRRECI